MKLRLVKDGIFPLSVGLKGEKIKKPETGFSVPGTIQGEGKYAGYPSIFIRTTGCNLRCSWEDEKGMVDICDTSYSSHDVTDFEEWETEEIVRLTGNNLGNIKHVVITGGEPCLQPQALTRLASGLKKELGVHITLETNGSIYVPELPFYVDLFSISPKLRSSEPSEKKNKKLDKKVDKKFIENHRKSRVNLPVIQKYINSCMDMESYYGDVPVSPVKRKDKDFQLKFVIARKEDEKEIKDSFLSGLGFVQAEDVLVMPLGSTPEKTAEHAQITAEMAVKNGWRFAPRIHLDVFGDRRSV